MFRSKVGHFLGKSSSEYSIDLALGSYNMCIATWWIQTALFFDVTPLVVDDSWWHHLHILAGWQPGPRPCSFQALLQRVLRRSKASSASPPWNFSALPPASLQNWTSAISLLSTSTAFCWCQDCLNWSYWLTHLWAFGLANASKAKAIQSRPCFLICSSSLALTGARTTSCAATFFPGTTHTDLNRRRNSIKFWDEFLNKAWPQSPVLRFLRSLIHWLRVL